MSEFTRKRVNILKPGSEHYLVGLLAVTSWHCWIIEMLCWTDCFHCFFFSSRSGDKRGKKERTNSLCKMKLLNQACWEPATIYGWTRHRAFILFILLAGFYGLSLGRNGMRAKQKCSFQSHFIPSSVGIVILGTLHKTLLRAQNWELGVLTLTHLCDGLAVAYASAYILSLVCPITTTKS